MSLSKLVCPNVHLGGTKIMKEKIMMEKEINNINFKGLIGYLRKHYGDEGVR